MIDWNTSFASSLRSSALIPFTFQLSKRKCGSCSARGAALAVVARIIGSRTGGARFGAVASVLVAVVVVVVTAFFLLPFCTIVSVVTLAVVLRGFFDCAVSLAFDAERFGAGGSIATVAVSVAVCNVAKRPLRLALIAEARSTGVEARERIAKLQLLARA
jgi:hypothetical protein